MTIPEFVSLGRSLTLQDAREHHLSGRYADAARVYRALLDRDPDDVSALHLFGVLHQQCGYPARAAELIGRAIELRPDVAGFHSNLAEAHRALKRHDLAADCCRAALRLRPDFPEAANNLGLAWLDLGRAGDALEQFDEALRRRPGWATAQNNRGTSLLALGREREAMDAYREAIRLDPDLALARANLGQILIDRGEVAEGLPHCEAAARLRPDLPAAHNNLGNALLALERWSEAGLAYSEAIRLDPTLAIAHANLGQAVRRSVGVGASISHFRRAVELAPDSAHFHRRLADALALNDDWASAILPREARARLEPEDPDAHCELGWAYQSDDRPAEAEAAYLRALALRPDHLEALLDLGSLLEERGKLADAESCYRRAEALHPGSLLPLARRALLVRGRLDVEDRDRLRSLVEAAPSPPLRMDGLFALAQVADARGDHAEAAACLGPANAIARDRRRILGQPYDPDGHSRLVDRLIAGFTPEMFARLGAAGDDRPGPVFVFGMPRSGTTLVEQVLASHGQVHGAGELPLIARAVDSLPDRSRGAGGPDEGPIALDAAEVRRLATAYREGVRALLSRRGGGERPARVVDKMPDNYLYLGPIALMFPKATLIHVRRDLRDVALSCWMTQFRSIRWADELDNLARRCRDYRRAMDHWRSILPVAIHEVSYDAMVDDLEAEVRRLVAACGLGWDPACLEFHRTDRTVRTASVTQVRQPIYRKSLARWKPYRPYLASLFDRLPVD